MTQDEIERFQRHQAYIEYQRNIPPSKEFIAYEKSQKRIAIYLLIGNLFFLIYFVLYFLGIV